MPPELLDSQLNTLEIPSYGLHLSTAKRSHQSTLKTIKKLFMELGIIGLGVMGQSLALNAWEKGIQVHGFNHFDTFEDLRRKSFEPTDICYSNDLSSFYPDLKRDVLS